MTRFACVALAIAGSARLAAGFAEDSAFNAVVQKSSAHYDLVLAFGRCLGLAPNDAQTVATYSEATDLGRFNGVNVNFTDRTGSNAAYFHAPQLVTTVDALAELAKWSDPSQAGRRYVPAQLPAPTLQTAQLSGTIGAFGIYLHAIGDRYSHKACIDAGYVPHCDGLGFPACTSPTEIELCGLGMGSGSDETNAHVIEYSDPNMTPNTQAGLEQMYVAMAQRYGKGSAIPPQLGAILHTFATTSDPNARVALAQSITSATCQ